MACQCNCPHKKDQDDSAALFLGQVFGGAVVLLSMGALVVLGMVDANLNFARVFALVFACFFGAVIAVVCFIIDAVEMDVEFHSTFSIDVQKEPEDDLDELPSGASANS